MGRLIAAQLDAVTVDAFGTFATLVDPIPKLEALLPDHARDEIQRAFRAEGEYYTAHVSEGRDAHTLADLRSRCVTVFNETLGSSLATDDYVGALAFDVLPGAADALGRLRALGLSLAVVANWDYGVHAWLAELELTRFFATVVHAAAKPAPDGILQAIAAMHVRADRTLHIGDSAADEEAARAAGVHFLPAPLHEAVASLG